jgi:5-formyltetrahydrofolate cyclo-ligase
MPRDKFELRREMRARRKAWVEHIGAAGASQAAIGLQDLALNLPEIGATRIWGGYNAGGSELDPLPLTATTRWTGAVSGRPWFADRSSAMLFRQFDGPQEPGPFGLQPGATSPVLEPDTVLVPLVAVDLRGNRLGQGGGHYDRALALLREHRRVIAVGIAWECQLIEEVPVEPWDQPLDFIATPERIIRVAK